MKMKKDGVPFEELEELAAQINFPLNSDEDYLRLFREARKLGWWPELDQPKMDTKHFWSPPDENDIGYRPRYNPWVDPGEPKKKKPKSAAMQQKEALQADLDKISKLIKALEQDPRAAAVAEPKLKGVEELDSWLDQIH